ncbi:MAG: PDZ domain-containing protein [Bacteroidota bacterium]
MMIRTLFVGLCCAYGLLLSAQSSPTRLLDEPALSDSHVAFRYANDLWIADRNGDNPRRLTVDAGLERNAIFSPDGKTVAFNAQYAGNTDVYTVPAAGGVPTRLTYYPWADFLWDYDPKGESVLFGSGRETFTGAHLKPYVIKPAGGQATHLNDIPTAFNASYSANGRFLAYNPLPEAFEQWKNYRGGRFSRIWIQNLRDDSVVEVPTEGSNDVQPQWLDGKVYFRSDRNGEFNLFSYDPRSKAVEQLTDYQDFPILDLGPGPDALVYAQAGYLHEFDPKTKQSKRINITIKTDLPEVRPRVVDGRRFLNYGSLSPTAARVVVDYRGDILTVPTKNGDVTNLTETPGVHESFPAWSPDGKTIAYFSDASGEHQLHLYDAKTKKAKEVKLTGTGFYAYIHWSPDSEKLAFVDNGRNIYVLDVADGTITKVDADDAYFPGAYRDLFGSWSADSRWLAYSKITETNFEQAFLYDTKANKSMPVSDGLSNVTEPIISPDGKYLYLSASTDAGPVVNWFQQSSQDMDVSNSIYLVTLQQETTSPLKRKNDAEEIAEDEEEEKEDEEDEESEKDDADEEEEEDESLQVDFDGIENRIIDLPIPPGNYYNLSAVKSGLLFISAADDGSSKVMSFNLEEQEAKPLMAAREFEVSANGKKLLFGSNGRWSLAGVGQAKGEAINMNGLRVKIDPRAEWKNIFHEAWRVNRDYFYDPDMHGVDWDAARAKYEPFLADVTCQGDLYEVMKWMMSELGVGHHRFGGPAPLVEGPEYVPGGLLGADYEVANNRYRIKKIYGGLNWNPRLRSPLTEPGVNVSEGEYLLAVDGENLVGTDNLYRLFEDKAGRNVTITVGPNADGSESREVVVTTINNERALRNRDWVEGNLKRVHEATNGQVAYVYVPNTAAGGHQYFKRYFFPQVDKKAIIVDERFNGGGQIADYYVELLSRPYQNSWTYRYGQDHEGPLAAIHGPKVLLVNEMAGSGGDLFPYLWRLYGLGPIIGKRTWGGLVGVLGFPSFIDGGSVTAPNVGFWDKDGFRVENEGVAPDIDVNQFPAQMKDGRDPQLERAIEEVMKMLKESPPAEYKRPPFEKRGTGLRE